MSSLQVRDHIFGAVRAVCNSLYAGEFIETAMLPLRVKVAFVSSCVSVGSPVLYTCANSFFTYLFFSDICPVLGFCVPSGGVRQFSKEPSLFRSRPGGVGAGGGGWGRGHIGETFNWLTDQLPG